MGKKEPPKPLRVRRQASVSAFVGTGDRGATDHERASWQPAVPKNGSGRRTRFSSSYTRARGRRGRMTGATTCYHQGALEGANGRQRCFAGHRKAPANRLKYAKNRKRWWSMLL